MALYAPASSAPSPLHLHPLSAAHAAAAAVMRAESSATALSPSLARGTRHHGRILGVPARLYRAVARAGRMLGRPAPIVHCGRPVLAGRRRLAQPRRASKRL